MLGLELRMSRGLARRFLSPCLSPSCQDAACGVCRVTAKDEEREEREKKAGSSE